MGYEHGVASTSNPELAQRLKDYIMQGAYISEDFVDTMLGDPSLLRSSLRTCLHDPGYPANQSAHRRFEEVASMLKDVQSDGADIDSGQPKSKRGEMTPPQFKTTQAIVLRKILRERGDCDAISDFYPQKQAEINENRKVCQECVVRLACAEYAVVFNEEYGLWGGLSERARRRIRKKIREDFGVTDISRELAFADPDSEVRVALRARLPTYLDEQDQTSEKPPGRLPKQAQEA